MWIIWTILFGALTGYVAAKITKSETNNIIVDCVTGIVGGVVGSLLLGLLGFKSTNTIGYIITGIIGACIVIFIKDYIVKKK